LQSGSFLTTSTDLERAPKARALIRSILSQIPSASFKGKKASSMPRVVIEEADDTRIKFEATVNRVGSGLAKRVFSMAMNSVGRKNFTQIKKALVEQTSLPKGIVHKNTKFWNSSRSKLETRVDGRREYFGLSHFKPKQGATGTSAFVWGKTQHFPHAFVVKSLSGNVFIRTSKKRLPIEKMYGPSIHRELMQDQSLATWQQGVGQIATEAQRLLGVIMSGGMK
jgi:hypothetical protein